VNHRAVQRALFRMQLDPGFAARLRAGESDAQLGAEELALLRAADPIALGADREQRRRRQFLHNVSEEFARSCAAGVPAEGFTSSPEFHEAVQRDASLPLAFGRYAERCSETGSPSLRALVKLERALARARREWRDGRFPAEDEIALAQGSWLVRLPEGTLDLASGTRRELGPAGREETVLISVRRRAQFGLGEVEAEALTPDLAGLLDAALVPRTFADLARACGETESELAEVVAGLVDDGVLVEG